MSTLRRSGIMLLLTLAAAGPAGADVLPLSGSYGNAAGCQFLEDGQHGDESVLALTPAGYETYATACEFLQALPAKDGSHVATMLCSHEGETFRTIDFLLIVKAGEEDAYELISESGEPQGTVRRCE